MEVKKSSFNLVNEYVVRVNTKDNEKAVVVVNKKPDTNEVTVVDLIKYVEPEVMEPAVCIEETINPVTQVV